MVLTRIKQEPVVAVDITGADVEDAFFGKAVG